MVLRTEVLLGHLQRWAPSIKSVDRERLEVGGAQGGGQRSGGTMCTMVSESGLLQWWRVPRAWAGHWPGVLTAHHQPGVWER